MTFRDIADSKRHLAPLALVLASLAHPAGAQRLEAPEARDGRVAVAAPISEVALDPLERVRALYRAHPAPPGSAGDVVVLDPDGQPLAGATVALVGGWGTDLPTLLEHAVSDAAGHVDLTQLASASLVVAWSETLPAVRLDGELLAEHRRAAGGRALVVALEPSDELVLRVTVDGRAPEPGEVHPGAYFRGWMEPGWPAVASPLDRLLEPLDPPGRELRVELEDGTARCDRFRWPNTRAEHVPATATVYVKDECLFVAQPLAVEVPYGQDATRYDLRKLEVARANPHPVLPLERGVWVRGRVRIAGREELPEGMILQFGLPGTRWKREQVEVGTDGSFRFALPRALFDLRLELLTRLAGRDGLRRYAFEVPDPAPKEVWDLGVLEMVLEGTRELRVRDPAGEPVEGAWVEHRDARLGGTLPPPLESDLRPGLESFLYEERSHEDRARTSDSRGRLLVRTPGAGEELWVDHPGYQRTRVRWTEDPVQTVVLHPAAQLTLTARIPDGFPASRLLVQLEAEGEVLGLVRGSRSEALEASFQGFSQRIAAGLYDARSRAAWSFTTDFGMARPAPAEASPGELALRLRTVRPGVPFRLRVFDPAGGVFLDAAQAPFLTGERRELAIALPTSARMRRGRILRADGSPASGLEVSFGAPLPVAIAITDEAGEFAFSVLEDAPGTLLSEEALQWMGCFAGPGYRGREPQSCARWRDVRFSPGRTTELQLEPLRELHITPVDGSGAPSPVSWRIELRERGSGLLLGASGGSQADSAHAVRTLRVPADASLLAMATFEHLRVERELAPDETEIQFEVPTLGALELTIQAFADAGGPVRVSLVPREGGAPLERRSSPVSPELLGGLPPGMYTVTAFLDPSGPGEERHASESADVVVVAGATVPLTLR